MCVCIFFLFGKACICIRRALYVCILYNNEKNMLRGPNCSSAGWEDGETVGAWVWVFFVANIEEKKKDMSAWIQEFIYFEVELIKFTSLWIRG